MIPLLPVYITLQDLAKQIDGYSNTARPRKIGLSFTGGGVRALYESAVVEAILQEFANSNLVSKPLRPDLVAGASSGGVISTSLFIDQLYNSPTPATSIYTSKQSETGEIFQQETMCEGLIVMREKAAKTANVFLNVNFILKLAE